MLKVCVIVLLLNSLLKCMLSVVGLSELMVGRGLLRELLVRLSLLRILSLRRLVGILLMSELLERLSCLSVGRLVMLGSGFWRWLFGSLMVMIECMLFLGV